MFACCILISSIESILIIKIIFLYYPKGIESWLFPRAFKLAEESCSFVGGALGSLKADRRIVATG
jgi:hypothetical protein